MKRLAVGLSIVSLLTVGTLAYAQEHGGMHMEEGASCHMMEGYGGEGHKMGHGDETSGKFLDETYALRKELHDKKFEYREALRNHRTPRATIARLERQIQGLKEKIHENSPEIIGKSFGSPGCME